MARGRQGGFADAVATGRARLRVPGVAAEVTVAEVGPEAEGVQDAVDASYRLKYDAGDGTVSGMVTADARRTTLRLDPLAA